MEAKEEEAAEAEEVVEQLILLPICMGEICI